MHRKEIAQDCAEPRSVYCVVGAGNGGMAMAAHLGVMGFRVRLFNRTAEHLEGVRWHGGIKVEGEIEGFGPVELATSSMEEALEGVDIAMVVTPSTAHRGLASLMAPHLRDNQIVVLNPGRTGGALEFLKQIRQDGLSGKPIIAEAQTFLYASRALSRYEARIFRIKNEVPVAALPAHKTAEVLRRLEPAFPWFSPGGDVLSTSLENIGAVFHPALPSSTEDGSRRPTEISTITLMGLHPRSPSSSNVSMPNGCTSPAFSASDRCPRASGSTRATTRMETTFVRLSKTPRPTGESAHRSIFSTGTSGRMFR